MKEDLKGNNVPRRRVARILKLGGVQKKYYLYV